jgi:hypothetical protein
MADDIAGFFFFFRQKNINRGNRSGYLTQLPDFLVFTFRSLSGTCKCRGTLGQSQPLIRSPAAAPALLSHVHVDWLAKSLHRLDTG